jgi:hypothetical protein
MTIADEERRKELRQFRAQIDDSMKYSHHSPLDPAERRRFQGLNHFEYSEELAFAARVERFPEDEPPIVMQTSTGDSSSFRRWGRFTFEVDGQEVSLTIYSDPDGEEFFLPFKDKSNGQETYGAGRYLDNARPGLWHLGGAEVGVDFNYAYNPYCAYNENYSCPLPPRENWLDVKVPAGEKKYK